MFALSFLGSACLHCLQNSMAELHWYPFIEVKEFNMPSWQKTSPCGGVACAAPTGSIGMGLFCIGTAEPNTFLHTSCFGW